MSFIYTLFISLKHPKTFPDKPLSLSSFTQLKSKLFKKDVNDQSGIQDLTTITHIEGLVLEGKYSDALQELELLSGSTSLSQHTRYLLSLLKAEIYYVKGDPKAAEQTALTILEKIPQNANPFDKIDALLTVLDAYNTLGKHAESLKLTEECTQILQKSSLPSSNYYSNLRSITLLLYKARSSFNLRNLTPALEFARKAVFLSKEINYIPGLAHAYSMIGFYYGEQGNLSESLNYRLQALELYRKINDKRFIANTLDLISTLYVPQGEEDTALEYQLEALNLSKTINNRYFFAHNTTMIGIIYFYKGEFENSLNNLKSAAEIYEQLDDEEGMSDCLWPLIYISVLVRDRATTDTYFQKLKSIAEHNEDSKFIVQRYRFIQAIVLKLSPRLADKAKAQELFQQLNTQDGVFFRIKTLSVLSLCELLLDELKTTGNKDLLAEIKLLIDRLIDSAAAQNIYTDLIRAYIIQSHVALLEFDIKRSQYWLTLAQNKAEDKGLNFLSLFVSKELDDFTSKSSHYMELIQKHVNINDLIELMFPEDNLVQLIYKRTATMLDIRPETPIMFLIVINTGLCLFSQSFPGATTTDDQLIAGLLTAINQFSGEVFSQTIDRIKFREYTLLLKAKEPLLFCYLFNGASYTALKKLEALVLNFSTNQTLWNMLIENGSVGRVLTEADSQSINQYIQEFTKEYTTTIINR